jgi:hypothetical protein
MVVVEERRLADARQAGGGRGAGSACGRRSRQSRCAIGAGARGHLEAERQGEDREAGPVGPDLVSERAQIREDPLVALAHLRCSGRTVPRPRRSPLPRVHDPPHERGAPVKLREPPRGPREVVLHLRHVVEADADQHLVRVVVPNDAAVSDELLACGPAAEGHVHHVEVAARGRAQFLEHLRPGLLRAYPPAQGHAVAEADDSPGAWPLLDRVLAITQALGVVVLPRRPAHGRGLHGVEVTLPRLPVGDVVSGRRGNRRLVQAGDELGAAEEKRDGPRGEREVEADPNGACATEPLRGHRIGRSLSRDSRGQG